MNALKPMPGEGEGRDVVIPIGRDAARPDNSRTLPKPRSGRVFIAGALLLAGGSCCIGSPIDDRQYRLLDSFNMPWPSSGIPSTVGPSGAL
jgi:hypothetical protein